MGRVQKIRWAQEVSPAKIAQILKQIGKNRDFCVESPSFAGYTAGEAGPLARDEPGVVAPGSRHFTNYAYFRQ